MTCVCFRFCLIHSIICICCHWPNYYGYKLTVWENFYSYATTIIIVLTPTSDFLKWVRISERHCTDMTPVEEGKSVSCFTGEYTTLKAISIQSKSCLNEPLIALKRKSNSQASCRPVASAEELGETTVFKNAVICFKQSCPINGIFDSFERHRGGRDDKTSDAVNRTSLHNCPWLSCQDWRNRANKSDSPVLTPISTRTDDSSLDSSHMWHFSCELDTLPSGSLLELEEGLDNAQLWYLFDTAVNILCNTKSLRRSVQ